MTGIDLDAVCVRHRIALAQLHSGEWRKASGYGPRYPTQADAICGQLKIRHRITTRQLRATKHHEAMWDAQALVNQTQCNRMGDTELEAVVALADQLEAQQQARVV